MAKRLVFFNHKGGVSKTTSAYNIGWMLSKDHRVLLVDADPQCNLTGLILREDFEQYYIDDGTRTQNIMDGVRPAFDGRPTPIQALNCITQDRAPNLHLMPGHANLSEYDAALTFAQTANNAIVTLQNLPGAFAALLDKTEERYSIDYTIIDLNPGLSAINQNLFLISDAFIVPTNPDPFSLQALDTLRSILPRWNNWKRSAQELFANSAYPLPTGSPKFVGSLIQRFNVRNGKAARPYRDNIAEINDAVSNRLKPNLDFAGMTFTTEQYGSDLVSLSYCLDQIPDFHGLLPKAHSAGVPVFEITDEEIGETGPIFDGMRTNRDNFRTEFDVLSGKVRSLVDLA